MVPDHYDSARDLGRGAILDALQAILWPRDEEPDSPWNGGDVCQAVSDLVLKYRPEAWARQMYRVTVRCVAEYVDGVTDFHLEEVPEPEDGIEDLTEWWEREVWPRTGSGRAGVDARYWAEITKAFDSGLVGKRFNF